MRKNSELKFLNYWKTIMDDPTTPEWKNNAAIYIGLCLATPKDFLKNWDEAKYDKEENDGN